MGTNYCHLSLLAFIILWRHFNGAQASPRCSKFNSADVNTNIYINDTSSTIYSPDYSSFASYPSNTACRWTISAPTGHIIKVNFTLFDLEPPPLPSSGCTNDYVVIYDGWKSTSPVIGQYCGKLRVFTIKSTGRFISLYFYSNLLIGGKGFIANYQTVKATPSNKHISTSKPVPVALIIVGTAVTTLIIIAIVCFAITGKFSFRTRKRARRLMSRASLSSRVSTRSSQSAVLPQSCMSLKSSHNGRSALSFHSKTSPGLPELVVTNVEGKQTRLFPVKLKVRAVIHPSPPLSRRRHRSRFRRLSAENSILPTPPTLKRNMAAIETNWDIYIANSARRHSFPTPPPMRRVRHSIGGLSHDGVT